MNDEQLVFGDCVANSGNIPVFGSMKGKFMIAEDFDAPLETMLMSEKALAMDWNSAEEDAAWANLNNEKVDNGLAMMVSTIVNR